MSTAKLKSGSSLASLLLILSPISAAKAQQQLPVIDVGKPVAQNAAKPRPGPRTGASRLLQGDRGNQAPAGVAGGGLGGYGGAGPAQDPYNKTYLLKNTSTGTKTDTPVMDTPLNVQSVSQQVLRDQQAITIGDALQNFSGVTVLGGVTSFGGSTGLGGGSILLRGFQTNTYYRDGFRVDSTYAGIQNVGIQQLANIASVEVLKGPGATLYGLVDPGGVINFITKEPLSAPYYAVQQQAGSLALYRTTVDATGPLNTDKSLLYRVNASYESNGAPRGSFIDNTYGWSLFLAPVLKWNISESTWVKLEGQYNHNHTNTYYAFNPLFNGRFIDIPRNTNYGAKSPTLRADLFAALTWSHQFDKDWSIKQQIAYNRYAPYQNYFAPNLSDSSIPGVRGTPSMNWAPQSTYSTNVDITGHINTFGAKHTLLLGGDVYLMNLSPNFFFSPVPFRYYNSLFDPVSLGIMPAQCCSTINGQSISQNTAGLYVQDQIELPHNIFLMAGARYQYIRQSFAEGPASYYLTPREPVRGEALTPRFGLLWRPQPWLSLYGNYTEGFGPNTISLVFPGSLSPPTSARSWEAGAKIELFDGKLRATAAYYNLEKTNVPFTDTNPAHDCGSGPGSCVVIAGAARSTGPELDIQGEILPGWSVIASYTNQDVRVVKANWNNIPALGGTLPHAGQRVPGVPRNQASLWTTYEFQNDSVLEGFKVGAGYRYMGSRPIYDNVNYTPYVWPLLSSYGTVDLMGAYNFRYAGSKVTAQLNVTNLFDRTYYESAINFRRLGAGYASNLAYRPYGAPFAIMGSLRAELDQGATPAPWLLPVATAGPSLPSFTWTGLYVGGHMGYGWGLNDGSINWNTARGLPGQTILGSGANGMIAGAHVGYNQQFSQLVLGLEGAVDDAILTRNLVLLNPNIAAQAVTGVFAVGGVVTGVVQAGVQGSLLARGGYAFGRLLPYVMGGVAVGSFKSDANLFGPDLDGRRSAASGASAATRWGWTAGAGVEYAINNHWSVRGEYRYSDFGHLGITAAPWSVGAVFALNRHLNQQQVQVGFSYKFGPLEPEPMDAPMIVKGPALANGFFAPAVAPLLLPIDWTGFYVGAQIGYGWGLNDGTIAYATAGGLAGEGNLGADAVFGSSNKKPRDVTGVIGGAHLGYNRQFDNWVVGVEGAVDPTLLSRNVFVDLTNLAATRAGLGSGGTVAGAVWSPIQGSLRARAGYALDRLLFYGTGGVALGAFGSNFWVYGVDLTRAPFYAADRRSSFNAGWTVGGGVEYAVNPNWSVRGEYRYSDFGRLSSPAASALGVTYVANRHLEQNQVQMGVSYKFGEPAPVPVIAKY